MKLDVYKKGEIVKTYEAETYDLMYGTVEDIFTIFNFDDITETKDIYSEIVKKLPSMMALVKPLLIDVFGITSKELRNVRMKDIMKVILDIVKYSFAEMGKE